MPRAILAAAFLTALLLTVEAAASEAQPLSDQEIHNLAVWLGPHAFENPTKHPSTGVTPLGILLLALGAGAIGYFARTAFSHRPSAYSTTAVSRDFARQLQLAASLYGWPSALDPDVMVMLRRDGAVDFTTADSMENDATVRDTIRGQCVAIQPLWSASGVEELVLWSADPAKNYTRGSRIIMRVGKDIAQRLVADIQA